MVNKPMTKTLLLPTVAVCALFLGCSDEARPPALEGGETCTGAGCGPQDGGVTQDAEPQDAAPDAYTGPVGTARGTIFAMEPPAFAPFKSDQTPALSNPATISLYAHGIQYSADYVPGDGFELADVPAGSWPVLVEDVDDGNGLMPSLIGGTVPNGGETTWEFPTTKRASLETILSGLAEPIELDPTRAQLIVTVVTCQLQGGSPVFGAKIIPPENSGGIVYETGGQWELNASSGTSTLGTAVMVNVPSEPYPGVGMSLDFVINDDVVTTDDLFWTMEGAVTRVYFSLEC